MNKLWRFFAVIFVLYSTLIIMKFLQNSFDEGDLRRAREALGRVQVQNQTVWQAMANQLNVNVEQVHCEELLMSRYSGPVRFECFSGTEKQNLVFIWNVDVVGFRVTPGNDLSEELLRK